MPGDGEDAIGLDQKPDRTGSLTGSLQLYGIEWACERGWYTLHVWSWKKQCQRR